jgi:hypothetical protein
MEGRSRDDRTLYTGGGSTLPPSVSRNPAVDKLNAERVERKQAKEAEQKVISDAAPIFSKMIDAERKATELQILKMVGPGTDDKVLKETLAALNLYDTSLKNLNQKLQTKLRSPTIKDT